MKLFNKNNNNSEVKIMSKTIENISKSILASLGYDKEAFSYNFREGGGSYIVKKYTYHELSIEYTFYPIKCLTIYFNDDLVYSSSKKIYVPGKWETVLELIYENIPIFVYEVERKTQLEKNKKNILDDLVTIAQKNEFIDINDYLKVTVTSDCFGYNNGHYKGRRYEVTNNGKIVFSAYIYAGHHNKDYNVYVPGKWEELIHQYAIYIKSEEEKRKKIENDLLAEKTIERLRKLK